MALIKCPECKKEISDTSKKCPKCGYEIEKENNKKKQQELINESKNKVNDFIELLKKNKKKLIIVLIVIITLIVGYYSIIKIKDIVRENNRKDYPSQKELAKHVEKELINELTQITINKKGINKEYKSSNIKKVKYNNNTYDSLEITFYYHIEDSVSFDIPFSAYYSFDGKDYTYDGLRNNTDRGEAYKNVKITSCKDIKNNQDKNANEYIEEKYKQTYGEMKLVSANNKHDNVCEYVYEGKKEGKYIKKNVKVTMTNTVEFSTEKEEFTVYTIMDSLDESDVTFDLVGKYTGNHTTIGYFHDKGTVNFEITKMDKFTAYLGPTGKIREGSFTYTLVAKEGYISYTKYDYYILDVGFKFGTDASGVDRNLEVRVYPDKLLYYCSYDDESTKGCYELTKK